MNAKLAQAKDKTAYHVVMIEWDGMKPPTKFYRRLHQTFNLGVRDADRMDKSVGPVFRRMGSDGAAVIFQESCVLTTSRTMAWKIREYALEFGASAARVFLGSFDEDATNALTEEDRRAFERIEAIAGRRGRPLPAVKWVIACKECLQVSGVESSAVASCPQCGSLLFNIRTGIQETVAEPGGDVVDRWFRLRFARGRWEPARIVAGQLPAPTIEEIDEAVSEWARETERKSEKNALTLLKKSDGFLAFLRMRDKDEVETLLDAAFMARAYHPREMRQHARTEALGRYFVMDGHPNAASIIEGDEIDLLDCALLIGPAKIASLLAAIYGIKETK